MGDRLQTAKPRWYFAKPRRSSQSPTLHSTGNEYWPKCSDALRLGIKAGWLIPYVDKRVGDRQNCVIPCANWSVLEMSIRHIIKCYTNVLFTYLLLILAVTAKSHPPPLAVDMSPN